VTIFFWNPSENEFHNLFQLILGSNESMQVEEKENTTVHGRLEEVPPPHGGAHARRPVVAIVGTPNVGKSALFNRLTRNYSNVANYPYTTVEVARGTIVVDGKELEIIDTPGINSLNTQSEDEMITRDIILRERPGILIQCVDAANLKRSLVLTSELLETGIPFILCLNHVDEARDRGLWINPNKLSRTLNVPVIETIAPKGKGLNELKKVLRHRGNAGPRLPHTKSIEDALRELRGCFPKQEAPSVAVLILLLLGDKSVLEWLKEEYGELTYHAVKRALGVLGPARGNSSALRVILAQREKWAGGISEELTERSKISTGRFLERAGELTRHPIYGWPILFGIIYMIYLVVGEFAAIIMVDLLNERVFDPINGFVGELIPWTFWREFAVGDYGILTTGLTNALGTVLPILALFFLILNALEDIGYLPNLCILSNRFFKKMGLSGKSTLPIVLGFGCKTVATLTTRILDSKKERYIAIFLIAFAIPCSAQLGVNIAVLALFPFSAFVVVFGVLALVEIVAGLSLNRILKEERHTDFIMEIPPLRLPNPKNLFLKTYYRLRSFLIEAVPLFIIGAVVLFAFEKLGMKTALSMCLIITISSLLIGGIVNYTLRALN
jgi:ferrous iron transport protein B